MGIIGITIKYTRIARTMKVVLKTIGFHLTGTKEYPKKRLKIVMIKIAKIDLLK
jgi:hypothetical protein